LTRELRCGVEDVAGGYRSEYGDDTDEEETDEGEIEEEGSEEDPKTGSSGGRGDDEMSDHQPSSPGAHGRKSGRFDR